MIPEIGIHHGIDFEVYKSWNAVNKSMIPHILKSGKHLKLYLDGDYKKQTKVMGFGTLVDTLLFESEEYENRFVITPATYTNAKLEVRPWSGNANVCKAWKTEQDTAGTTILKDGDKERADSIIEEIYKHPIASKLIDGAAAQVSIVWEDLDTGVLCKCRFDALKENESMADLKITNDPQPEQFSKIMSNFSYHIQGVYYHDGYYGSQGLIIPEVPKIPFSFIACEDKPPYDVICYTLGSKSFDIGRALYKKALQKYVEYTESKKFPGYSNFSNNIDLPNWAINQHKFKEIV